MYDPFDLDNVEPNSAGLKTLEQKLAWVEQAGRDPELRADILKRLGLPPEIIQPDGLPDPKLTTFMQVTLFDNREVRDRSRQMTDFGVGIEFYDHHLSKTKRNRLKGQSVMLFTKKGMLRKLSRMEGASQDWQDQMRMIVEDPANDGYLFGPVVSKKKGTHYIEGQIVLARFGEAPKVIILMRDEGEVLQVDRFVDFTSGDKDLGGNAIATARIAFGQWEEDKWSTEVIALVD